VTMIPNNMTGIAVLIGLVVITLLFHRISELQREVESAKIHIQQYVSYDEFMDAVDLMIDDALERRGQVKVE